MSAENNNIKIPSQMPLLPVRDLVVFPYMILPLYVGRESSIKAVEKALTKDRMIFLSSQVEGQQENPKPDSIYAYGTFAMIMRMRKLSDGRVKILVQGLSKGRIKDFIQETPFFEINADKVENEIIEVSPEVETVISCVRDKIEKIISYGRALSPDILLVIDDIKDPNRLADLVASNLGLRVSVAQKILESSNAIEKFNLLDSILEKEIELYKNSSSAKGDSSESFIKQQMKSIKNELSESEDDKTDEIKDYKNKIKEANIPESAEKEALRQLRRLEKMHPESSESSMLRNYLDWMTELPWSTATEDALDLTKAATILDSDHHGLDKAKERVLEYLAVRQLKNSIRGPILCFAGPPGVGKTSLGKSIAKSMGRSYQRIALGGCKDEAEIRGHRRTYVGAMPGKIVSAIKAAGTNNPVIVLDEIDKLGSDFRGDPSAAMLEVLDPEQNSQFRDNYLNVDFDLSNVLFIATANVVQNIPPALKDRMELINIPGYTANDKLEIAKKHLVNRQIEENGLNGDENIEFKESGIKSLINQYTREAGLRNLEREIGSVCRKIAKKVVHGAKEKFIINEKLVHELMGPPRFIKEDPIPGERIGIATGLAWTQVGGEILYVEALAMEGKGNLTLTGQLGDVMKESASAAWSYAKAHCDELGIEKSWFENNNVHIHLPAGAIPKDGPSAGVTLATALISLITKNSIRKDIAMTGELTLTGRVLPVGGIREKALAALNTGIKNVIVPYKNAKDLEDIPTEFKKEINFILVENIDEVLQVAFEEPHNKKKNDGRASKGKTAAA